MVIAHSAKRLMRIFLGERKGIGLKFAANVHIILRVNKNETKIAMIDNNYIYSLLLD